MDRSSLTVLRRLGIAGALSAGTLIAAACGDGVTAPSAVVGTRGPAAGIAAGEAAVDFTTQDTVVTPDELKAHGWSCRITPEGTTACSPPGRGLPVFGAPADRPPTYLVHVFDTETDEYLSFTRMIRTDLYQGQICPSTGAAYLNLPHIGYYACVTPAH
jgi:hypothetical protein